MDSWVKDCGEGNARMCHWLYSLRQEEIGGKKNGCCSFMPVCSIWERGHMSFQNLIEMESFISLPWSVNKKMVHGRWFFCDRNSICLEVNNPFALLTYWWTLSGGIQDCLDVFLTVIKRKKNKLCLLLLFHLLKKCHFFEQCIEISFNPSQKLRQKLKPHLNNLVML